MPAVSPEIKQLLTDHNQLHLIAAAETLTDSQARDLEDQIRAIDFDQIASARDSSASASDDDEISRADRAIPPATVIRPPASEEERQQREDDIAKGNGLLADGAVAVITVAGGQGTRLGFDRPKGMFQIGPVSNMSLFQIFAEQIAARRERHRGSIPWLVMTSDATHQETQDYFNENRFFGLDPKTVHFFKQGSMPAVDAASGQILMNGPGSICRSPDGHGGMVTALDSSGLLQQLFDAGVKHFFYHQVDNPTVIICDPALIGVHDRIQSDLTTNVVRKVDPMERMGVLVDIDGETQIIEYSELTEQQAHRQDEDGDWVFWAGNTAIHVFRLSFLQSLVADGCQLELHVAHKKVPHLGADGELVEPSEPNAHKFERFIFDALPLAQKTLIVEGDRDREFNPVKNATGSDSPETSQAAISRIGREWLKQSGVNVSDDQVVEVSPATALDSDELKQKLDAGSVTVEQLTK